jgi:hypothetical protein
MRPWTRLLALAAAFCLAPTWGFAQTPAGSSGAASEPVAEDGGDNAAPSPASAYPATGYGWSTPASHPAAVQHTPAPQPGSANAVMSGFEKLDDGSTRVFVELTKPVTFETRKSRQTLTYVLKNAHVARANNRNPLVTSHFKTPVTSARLSVHGRDLWFVIGLRADVTPTATMEKTTKGTSVLRIDFAKGDYGATSPSAEHTSETTTKPAHSHARRAAAHAGEDSQPESQP